MSSYLLSGLSVSFDTFSYPVLTRRCAVSLSWFSQCFHNLLSLICNFLMTSLFLIGTSYLSTLFILHLVLFESQAEWQSIQFVHTNPHLFCSFYFVLFYLSYYLSYNHDCILAAQCSVTLRTGPKGLL